MNHSHGHTHDQVDSALVSNAGATRAQGNPGGTHRIIGDQEAVR